MNPIFTKLTSEVDAAKSLLNKIRSTNQRFYNEFVREYLTDRVTLTNFLKDLTQALYDIEDIDVVFDVETNSVAVTHNGITEKCDDFESAIEFAVALLNIRK